MEEIEVTTHQYDLRDRSTIKQTQVFGSKRNSTDEEKSMLRRVWSSIRKGKNKKGEKADQSDSQTNGQLSPKPKKSGKGNTGNRKRAFKDRVPESNTEGDQQNKNAKNKKKAKKVKTSKDDKNYKDTTPTECQFNKEEEIVDLNKDIDENKPASDISPDVEQVNDNINSLNIDTESVEVVSSNEDSQIVDEYEEKCLKRITEIFEKSKEFENKIDTFSDFEGSQSFYYIDENLQRNIEKLDRMDIRDSVLLREGRKNAIKYIYTVIERLEAKAKENEESQTIEVV